MGATDLLRASEGEVLLMDLQQGAERLADEVEALLGRPGALLQLARRAAARARSWDEAANARQLTSLIREALAKSSVCGGGQEVGARKEGARSR